METARKSTQGSKSRLQDWLAIFTAGKRRPQRIAFKSSDINKADLERYARRILADQTTLHELNWDLRSLECIDSEYSGDWDTQ